MAYAYADYETRATDPLRLDALRLHIAEVSLEAQPDVAADGMSRGNAGVISYLAQLQKRRAELEAAPGNRINGGVSRVRFVGP
jgi:hypothetical protein